MKKSRVVKKLSVFVEIRLIILGRCVALWVNKVLILESKFCVHRTANTVHDLLTFAELQTALIANYAVLQLFLDTAI